MYQEFIAVLHKWWQCDMHTKDPGSPVYCYNLPGTNVCYQLSHNSISYWAIQIVSGSFYFLEFLFLTVHNLGEGKSRG